MNKTGIARIKDRSNASEMRMEDKGDSIVSSLATRRNQLHAVDVSVGAVGNLNGRVMERSSVREAGVVVVRV